MNWDRWPLSGRGTIIKKEKESIPQSRTVPVESIKMMIDILLVDFYFIFMHSYLQ